MSTSSLHTFDRRTLLRGGLAGLGGVAGVGLLGACGTTDEPVPGGKGWRRFAGTTINFASENSAPTAAIGANLKPFTDLTGINVRIVTFDITSLAQRISLDFASGAGQYHVVYADPWMILSPMAKGFADLREFIEDDSYPPIARGLGDFIPNLFDAEVRFGSEDAIYTLPYDCPTLILHYRADLFEKYHDQMVDALGFDPTPRLELTWEQLAKVAEWFNTNVSEVNYGLGLMAKQHDSLSCDFSSVMWAYGADLFEHGDRAGAIGIEDPGKCVLDSEAGLDAARFYRHLVTIAHPASSGWDWDATAAALRGGQIAMCAQWHENAAANEEALPGKVGYAPLPSGPARSANVFGGTGIGINDAASGAERGAAWLFVNWATSPSVQLTNLASAVGGGTPTRSSTYREPSVVRAEKRPSDMPNMLSADAVRQAWQPENLGLRPKIPMWNEVLVSFYSTLSKMVAGDLDPQETVREISSDLDTIVARGWKA